MEEAQFPNAQQLYERVLPLFKNMTKKMRDSLTEEQIVQKNEALHILNLNLSLCHLKRNDIQKAIKAAQEAIQLNNQNPKAFFRLALAYKENSELDLAIENIKEAIKLSPGDANLRKEL